MMVAGLDGTVCLCCIVWGVGRLCAADSDSASVLGRVACCSMAAVLQNGFAVHFSAGARQLEGLLLLTQILFASLLHPGQFWNAF